MNTDQAARKPYTKIRGIVFEILQAVRIYKPDNEIVDRIVLTTPHEFWKQFKILTIQIIRWNKNDQEVLVKINDKASGIIRLDQVDEWIEDNSGGC